eukprot:TRINITY_DN1302_c4_g1_i1.p1 TRINITY_DN1302_c4_g1~~TRINITY_DN1302_c4_g1_i1.p1  ORF type:complete len:317 (+),score=38.14 TRINITY_DN1302_c4_g1_i1:116-952(+)
MGNTRVYNFMLGEMPCTIVNDGVQSLPMAGVYPNISEKAIEVNTGYLHHPTTTVNAYTNALLCQSGDKLVLIDTGSFKYIPGLPPDTGKLVEILQSIDVQPEDIDVILISHGHADHYFGLYNDEDGVVFPKATVWITEADYQYFMEKEDPNFVRIFGGLLEGGINIQQFVPGVLFDGFEAINSTGHSPGHVVYKVSSGDQVLYSAADAILIDVSLSNPEWRSALDVDPEAAINKRYEFYSMMVDTGALVHAYHLGFPGLGYIEADGPAFQWIPIQWAF